MEIMKVHGLLVTGNLRVEMDKRYSQVSYRSNYLMNVQHIQRKHALAILTEGYFYRRELSDHSVRDDRMRLKTREEEFDVVT